MIALHPLSQSCRLAQVTALLISLGAAVPLPVQAEPLLAQRVVEGLPPPPDTPYLDQGLPPPLIQPAQPSVDAPPLIQPALPNVEAPSVTAPVPAATAESSLPQPEKYLVYVNGDSPLLLDQVRRIESSASVQTFEGQQVIQAGLFDGEAIAQRRVEVLAQQGIGAAVATVTADQISPATIVAASTALPSPDMMPLVSVDRQVEFGQSPDFSQFSVQDNRVAQASVQASSYYVVIPGRARDLPTIADLTILLGGGLNVPERSVRERTSPLGPHVIIGPFVSQSAANRWNRYFRDFVDRDSRVYYRR